MLVRTPSVHSARTVISLRVSVPVLSDTITVVLPNVSTAGRERIIAPRCAMRRTPTANVIVSTTGNPSGMADTATATAVKKISAGDMPRTSPMTSTSVASATIVSPTRRLNTAKAISMGVAVRPTARIASAMRPNSVAAAVRTTTPRPRPCTTVVPANAMFT